MSRPTTKPKEIFEEHYYRGYKDGRGLKTIRQVIKIDPARGNVLFRNIGGGRDGWEDSLTIKKFIRWLEVEVEKPTETVVKDKPTRVYSCTYKRQRGNDSALPTPEALVQYKAELRRIMWRMMTK